MELTKAQVFSNAWNVLDADEEKETIKAHSIMGSLEIHPKVQELILTKRSSPNLDLPKLDLGVAEDYQGPKLDGPITNDHVREMVDAFSKNITLHYKYAQSLVKQAKELLEKQTSGVTDISVPNGGKVVVVGDTHGHLIDLFTIIKLAGFPSSSVYILFNGDFVDRGPNGPEVLFLIYALKVANPDYVFLNRGNHEMRRMNEKYNFEQQMRKKYDSDLFDLVQETFTLLPLCALINNKIIVLHGGLFEYQNVTINELRKINFKKQLPKHKSIREREDVIMEGIIWSDPHPEHGWAPSKRGAGVDFGPDVTAWFLSQNQLSKIIRSHQMVDPGYEETHNGKLITVFSASYYCGQNFNQGAIANIDSSLNITYTQYFAEILENTKTVSKDQKNETLNRLRDRIYLHRHPLYLAFTEADTYHTGMVTEEQWIQILSKVLNLDINWSIMRSYLADIADGFICYSVFLDRYRIPINKELTLAWMNKTTQSIVAKIIAKGDSLKKAFDESDINKDGVVSYLEFLEIVKKYDLGLTEEQTFDFMRSFDSDNNGSIDPTEFINRFIADFSRASIKDEDQSWMQRALKSIAKIISGHKKKKLKKSFKKFDQDKDGELSYEEFSKAITKLDSQYTEAERFKLAAYIDSNSSGKLSWKEFRKAFKFAIKHAPEEVEALSQNLLQQIFRCIHQNRVHLLRVFRSIDILNTQKVNVDEFKIALEAMNQFLEKPLDETQIKKLHYAIDKDKDGLIEYEKFLDCLEVADLKVV